MAAVRDISTKPSITGRLFRVIAAVLAVGYGTLVYVVFLGVFLYLIGFVGNLLVPKSVDSGAAGTTWVALSVDILLVALFALQHSIMARPGFKRWWTRRVPFPIERSTYVLMTSLVLALTYWQWQPLPTVIWQVNNPIAYAAVQAIFGLGWLIALLATFMINHFDLFGLRQVFLYASGKPYTDAPFATTGFYRFVRHPLMVGFLLAFWATPRMTVGHALFATAFTAYILLATRLEERDLVRALGSVYQRYQQRVPMLLPWPRRHRQSSID